VDDDDVWIVMTLMLDDDVCVDDDDVCVDDEIKIIDASTYFLSRGVVCSSNATHSPPDRLGDELG
jgi:hypothetical protein